MPGWLFFDLEGPLSSEDCAFELMGLFPKGKHVFKAVSRYDDLLYVKKGEEYVPGNALALIIPFLLRHGISSRDMVRLAKRARLIPGAHEIISWAKARGWKVGCITTAYEPFATVLTRKLGIPQGNVVATKLPQDKSFPLSQEEINLIDKVVEEIDSLSPPDDSRIEEILGRFFAFDLPRTRLGKTVEKVKPVGGQAKVKAVRRFCSSLADCVAVGDSITDSAVLKEVGKEGGISIAFNANEYALRESTVGLASTHISDLEPLLVAWEEGGRERVERAVKEKEGGEGDRPIFHWLPGKEDLSYIKEEHLRLRIFLRREAALLG